MSNYEKTFKKGQSFLKWCNYWIQLHKHIRHSSWKDIYPSIVSIQLNNKNLIRKYGSPYINANHKYQATYSDGFHGFLVCEKIYKGKWVVISPVAVDDLFE
jgi:hypothetical protein